MIAPEPIKLSDIDEYLEELTAIAETANTALNLCRRARMAIGRLRIALSIPAIAETKNMRRYSEDSWLTTQSRANPSRGEIPC
jgi:hypothetical protein